MSSKPIAPIFPYLGSPLVIITVLTAIFYNLTPFLGIDCWWHMKFGEYFLLNGKPVILDPFAIQAEKIIATYPNLFPAVLFLVIFKNFSFIGLNIFRVGLFILFIIILVMAVKKNWRHYSIFGQILLLIMAMHGRVILQPDLFNYAIFTLWILVLTQIEKHSRFSFFSIVSLLILETIWVNTHPLFFYHGLFIACVYLILHMLVQLRWYQSFKENLLQTKKEIISLVLLIILWPIVNPLGIRAFESLLINMLNPRIIPDSCRSTSQILHNIDFYYYVAVIMIALLKRPWATTADLKSKTIDSILAILLVIPALRYERCLPFLCIYLILWTSITPNSCRTSSSGLYPKINIAVCIFLSFFMVIDRIFLVSPIIIHSMGFDYLPAFRAGIGITDISKEESIREVKILDWIAEPGNCITNELSIGSAAVYHNPDKPFFWYGHAAVMNARSDQTQYFMTHPTSQEARAILNQYDIRTIVLMEGNHLFFKKHASLKSMMALIYMDPILSIYRRIDTLSKEQLLKISMFYNNFQPDRLDKQRFNDNELIAQYLYLWFSAEYTGNDGSRFLKAINGMISEAEISAFQKRMHPFLVESNFPNNSTLPPVPSTNDPS